ncbi:tyrosine-protein kinase Fer-like [Dreissena polymorpha]|nr:tyrosine-protein kinase Fer-like [Dreissena polymorpha]
MGYYIKHIFFNNVVLATVLTCLGCSELQDRTTRLTYTVTQEESREDGEIPLMINRDNVHAEQDITIDTTTLDQLNEYFTSKTLQRTTHQSNPVPTTLASPLHKESNGIDTSDVSSCSDKEFKRLSKENWFFGVLPRKEIEPLLTQDGDFLVRGSTNNPTDSKYVLSVFWKGPPPQHIKIIKKENGWYFQGDVFKTIIELVNYYLKNKKPIQGTSGVILSNPIQRDSWQLRNSHITLRSNIGDNQFYEVFLGVYKRSVAVRKCKDTSSAEQRKVFLENGLKLKQFDHPNVVKFLGIVAQREPVMIIMEYMSGGSLLKYLNENGQKQSRLLAAIMCLDAASGMAYLSEKGYIYRWETDHVVELSAKKCLVWYNGVVKISPFVTNGEDGEYKMPFEHMKWTAPEAAKNGTFTPMSDVWSFGVLMWEILSNGSEPYLGYTDAQTLKKVEEGYRMPAPQNTPDSIYQLMLKCWEKTPSSRITFQEMQNRLVTLINNPPSREKWS